MLVVSYNFLLECSCRADPLVKKGEEEGEIPYHFKNSFQSELCYTLNVFGR